jgi:molybdopterin synthase catalytic subunit
MFALQSGPIEPKLLQALLETPEAGAVVIFEGRVRNHGQGKPVTGMEYQAYEEMARREGERIIREARARFPVRKAACVHRLGALGVGEMAVWIGVASDHRAEAFQACQFIIEEVKKKVPIWKKEFFADETAHWVGEG